jgi:hypothetical protein
VTAHVAVVLPYWLIFITTGTARRFRGESAEVDQAHAEAIILFSLCVGYIVDTGWKPTSVLLRSSNRDNSIGMLKWMILGLLPFGSHSLSGYS